MPRLENRRKEEYCRLYATSIPPISMTAAARLAGFSHERPEFANRHGWKLMRDPEVRKRVKELRDAQDKKNNQNAQRVLQELWALATFDPGVFYDVNGNIRPINSLTPEERAPLEGVETIIRNLNPGDGFTDEVFKVKWSKKTDALKILAQHYGLLNEQEEVKVNVTYRWATPADTPEE